MMRGNTPTHTFTLPFDTALLSKVRVIYVQNNRRVLVKEDGTLLGNTVTVRLSQADTFMFDSKKPVEIQVRCLTKGGDVLTSDIMQEPVERCLDVEAIR